MKKLVWKDSTVTDNGIVLWVGHTPEVLITWRYYASGTKYLLALLSDMACPPERFTSRVDAVKFAEELFS